MTEKITPGNDAIKEHLAEVRKMVEDLEARSTAVRFSKLHMQDLGSDADKVMTNGRILNTVTDHPDVKLHAAMSEYLKLNEHLE